MMLAADVRMRQVGKFSHGCGHPTATLIVHFIRKNSGNLTWLSRGAIFLRYLLPPPFCPGLEIAPGVRHCRARSTLSWSVRVLPALPQRGAFRLPIERWSWSRPTLGWAGAAPPI